MSRVKLMACDEAAPLGTWAGLSDQVKSAYIRMCPVAWIGTTVEEMQAAAYAHDQTMTPPGQLSVAEIAILTTRRLSMRATYEREVGPLP